MNRYAIVVYPSDELAGHYPALVARDGTFARAGYDQDDIATRRDFPVAIFFDHEGHRDAELQALVKRNPNTMFCPVEIKQGFKTQPNPKATEFSFSQQGILPA